jgi:hypothetical protein
MPRKPQPPPLSTRRSSRRTSPSQKAAGGPSAPPTPPPPKRAKTAQKPDDWAEPALKAPAPSFEEQGLQRHPLFQTMEPLGKAPENKKVTLKLNFAKDKKSKTLAGEDSAKIPTPNQGGAKRARDEEETEGEGDEEETESEGEAETTLPLATASAARKEATLPKSAHASSPATPVARRPSAGPQTPSNPPTVLDQAMPIIAEKAKETGNEALSDAIRRVIGASNVDPKIARVIDAVKHSNPSQENMKKFSKLLRSAQETGEEQRKEAAKSTGTKKRTKSAPAQSSPTPNNPPVTKPAAPALLPSALPDTNSSTQTRRRAVLPAVSRKVSRAAARSNRASPTPNAVLPAVPRAAERSNDASTTPNTNGVVQTGTQTRARATRATRAAQQPSEPSLKQPVLQAPPAPAVRETRARKRGDSTSSDLSSVDEQIVKEGPPASHGAGSKRSAADAGFVEDAEIAARRKKLEDELNERRKEWEKDYPISDIRAPIQPSSQRRRAPAPSSTINGRSTRAAAAGNRATPEVAMADAPIPSPSLTNGRSSRTTGAADRNPRTRAGARTKHS